MLDQHREIEKIIDQAVEQTEAAMLEQLGDLVRMGLLIWEQGPMTLYQEPHNPFAIKVGFTGRLLLKDQEYLNQLEAQNDSLQKQLENKFEMPARPVRK